MSVKSIHGKKKFPVSGKRGKGNRKSPVIVTHTSLPAHTDNKEKNKENNKENSAEQIPPDQYAYVMSDLKMIAVVTGIILLLLLVLFFVLPR